MKNQVLKHKGQLGSVEFDIDREYLYGKLLHISDLVTYEAATLTELKKSFVEAVEDYLQDCKDLGVEPNKPCKGSFNVRVSQELHREVAIRATIDGVTLNEVCARALQEYVDGKNSSTVIAHYHNHTFNIYEKAAKFELEMPELSEDQWSIRSRKHTTKDTPCH